MLVARINCSLCCSHRKQRQPSTGHSFVCNPPSGLKAAKMQFQPAKPQSGKELLDCVPNVDELSSAAFLLLTRPTAFYLPPDMPLASVGLLCAWFTWFAHRQLDRLRHNYRGFVQIGMYRGQREPWRRSSTPGTMPGCFCRASPSNFPGVAVGQASPCVPSPMSPLMPGSYDDKIHT